MFYSRPNFLVLMHKLFETLLPRSQSKKEKISFPGNRKIISTSIPMLPAYGSSCFPFSHWRAAFRCMVGGFGGCGSLRFRHGLGDGLLYLRRFVEKYFSRFEYNFKISFCRLTSLLVGGRCVHLPRSPGSGKQSQQTETHHSLNLHL